MRLRSILILLVILLALGGYFYFTRDSEPPTRGEPRLFVWDIEIDEIEHIEIRLPREGKSEAFIKISKDNEFPWFFDDAEKSLVDVARWGGGIPLLLSGPGANRVIAEDATEEQLNEYGIARPQMEIVLMLEDESVLNIAVGDRTPDGGSFYVRAPESNSICLVDYTWYEVLERLVKEPPYVTPAD
ncbi:DUF4340 domain-containing protein [Chloroflexota bacterium]